MKMLIRTAVFAMLCVISSTAIGQIRWGVNIQIGTPPPPPRYEVIVERPYPEAVWVPGYWDYDYGGRSYIWVTGRWQRAPYLGAVWMAPRWHGHGRGYAYERGHWGGRGHGRGHWK
jgi:hypothetical protein